MPDIESLRKKVGDAKLELARSEERLAQIEKREQEVNKEIEAAGSTPDKLVEDIKAVEKEVGQEEQRIRNLLDGVESSLSGSPKEEARPEPKEEVEPEPKEEASDDPFADLENL